MNISENIRNQERRTNEIISIPEFGKFKIIPSINVRAWSEPGTPNVFDEEVRNETMATMHIRRMSQSEGGIKSFAGSLGDTMAFLGAEPEIAVKQEDNTIRWRKITPEEAVDLVNEWETNNNRIFTFPQNCDHVNNAKENSEQYGLTKQQFNAMMRHVGEKLDNEEMIAVVPVLVGNENKVNTKTGVAVVLTDEKNPKTLSAANINKNEIFVYDATMHKKSLESLAEFARERGIRITSDNLKSKANMQVNATLALRAEGNPVFAVNLRSKKPIISKIGSVPPPSQRA